MKEIIYKLIGLIFLLIGGFILTFFFARLPLLDGPEFPKIDDLLISCGLPSGLPFSFMGTWKYQGPGFIPPACAQSFNFPALALDIIFWTISLYFIWYIIRKYMLNKTSIDL